MNECATLYKSVDLLTPFSTPVLFQINVVVRIVMHSYFKLHHVAMVNHRI